MIAWASFLLTLDFAQRIESVVIWPTILHNLIPINTNGHMILQRYACMQRLTIGTGKFRIVIFTVEIIFLR